MMDTLPPEIVEDIMLRLSIRSLMHCGLVCRRFRDLFHDRVFSHFYSVRSLKGKPGIMFHNLVSKQNGLLSYPSEFSFIDQRNYTPQPVVFPIQLSFPNVNDFSLVASSNGLLCLIGNHDPNYNLLVCNPFLGKFIKLPVSEHQHGAIISTAIDFGFCVKTNSYKVLKVIKWSTMTIRSGQLNPEEQFDIFVHKLGDNSWNRIDWQGQGIGQEKINIINGFRSASNINGAFHWVSQSSATSLTVFDLEHDVFIEMNGPVNDIGRFSTIVVGNCLSVMNTHNDILEVWITREYGVSWHVCFKINLTQFFDTSYEYNVLYYRIEDHELMIFHNHYLTTYYLKEGRLVEISFMEDIWYRFLLHWDTLVLPLEEM